MPVAAAPKRRRTDAVTATTTTATTSSPPLWSRYFAGSAYDDEVDGAALTALQAYWTREKLQRHSKPPDEWLACVCIADYSLLSECWTAQQPATQPVLKQWLQNSPERVLSMLALAADLTLGDPIDSTAIARPMWRARIVGFPHVTQMKDFKSHLIGRWATVTGSVVRVSSVQTMITQLAFTCAQCDCRTVHDLVDGIYSTPAKCATTACKCRSFQPDREAAETRGVDVQKLRVQEKLLQSDTSAESGRVPRTVEIDVSRDLVDRVLPGDMVHVSGVVRYSEASRAGGKGKKQQGNAMHVLYLEANSISRASTDAGISGDDPAVKYDNNDLEAFRELQRDPDPFRLLVHSLCPAIFGHEMVKAGLLLALFGGRQRYLTATSSSAASAIRGDPHILVVGDPGLGKSQMLTAAASVAPRGVYVCGNTATSSGLTVTLTREAGSGEYAMEAGALVLGDRGCCCIDEFDKMTEHEALLEAMEQQSISIAKAGILCSLPARTSILAAANPVGGRYNKAKTVSENLKMNTALLSRFDLIFILVDKPNKEMDSFLSDHVMKMHSSTSGQTPVPQMAPDSRIPVDSGRATKLSDRLHARRGEHVDAVPPRLLRKYIAYCRSHIFPRISTEAAAVLQDFYLVLRTGYRSNDTAPITTRQLESMIRLAEARARSEMREVVTKQDAQDVVQIMQSSLYDTAQDENHELQFERSQLGTGMSKKSDIKRFVAKLREVYQRTLNDLFTHQQLFQIARDLRIRFDTFQDFLDLVNNQNYLMHRGNRVYKLSLSC